MRSTNGGSAVLRNVYIVCLTVGGLYAVLSAVFGNLLDFDFDFDFGFDVDLALPIKPFTVMVFLAVTGGVGLIVWDSMRPALTLLPAVPSGIAAAAALYRLVYVKLQGYESFVSSEEDAVMQRAQVVERIAPGGYGKVSYVINGNTVSGAAREKHPGDGIPKGRNVYIVEVRDNTYYVCEDLELEYRKE